MDESRVHNGGSGDGPQVIHDEDRDRYEVLEGTAVLGVLAYAEDSVLIDDDGSAQPVRDLRSTVVSPEHSGRGIGSMLVSAAVDDARERGLRLRATCWFARGWIDRHPEAAGLLADEDTGAGSPGADGTGEGRA